MNTNVEKNSSILFIYALFEYNCIHSFRFKMHITVISTVKSAAVIFTTQNTHQSAELPTASGFLSTVR